MEVDRLGCLRSRMLQKADALQQLARLFAGFVRCEFHCFSSHLLIDPGQEKPRPGQTAVKVGSLVREVVERADKRELGVHCLFRGRLETRDYRLGGGSGEGVVIFKLRKRSPECRLVEYRRINCGCENQ